MALNAKNYDPALMYGALIDSTSISGSTGGGGTARAVIATASSGFTADYTTDGTADDVQFQAAIDAVYAAGGGTIFIRAGTYTFSAAYVWPRSNITFIGEGEGTVINIPASGAFSNTQTALPGADLYGPCSNIKFLNFKMVATAQGFDDGLIHLRNCQNVEIAGMHMVASGGFTIFIGAFTTARGGTQDTAKVWIHDNYLTGTCAQDVIGGGNNFQPPTDWDFRDIIIENNHIVQVRSGGGTDTNGIDLTPARNAIIRGNLVEGNILLGNEKSGHIGCIIEGNVLKPPRGSTNERCAIFVEDDSGSLQSTGITIANNNIQSGQIWVKGNSGTHMLGVTITGNIIRQNSTFTSAGVLSIDASGINAYYTDRMVIADNYVDCGGVNPSNGVLISNCLNSVITDNMIYQANNGIIEFQTCSGNYFSGNYLLSNTTPFTLISGSDAIAINNKGASTIDERKSVYAKNTSGGSVGVGDIVTLKAVAAGNEFTTTTTQGDPLVYGMAMATIANNGSGFIQTLGKTTALKVDGTTDIAIGDFIGTYTTAKISMKASVGDTAFAIALEAYATNDSSGVIDALLIPPRKI